MPADSQARKKTGIRTYRIQFTVGRFNVDLQRHHRTPARWRIYGHESHNGQSQDVHRHATESFPQNSNGATDMRTSLPPANCWPQWASGLQCTHISVSPVQLHNGPAYSILLPHTQKLPISYCTKFFFTTSPTNMNNTAFTGWKPKDFLGRLSKKLS